MATFLTPDVIRQVLLAVAQILAGVLVFVGTGTLIVAQLANAALPRAMRSFPRRPVIRFFLPLTMLMITDLLLALLIHPDWSSSGLLLAAIVALITVAATGVVIPYSEAILDAVNPATLIELVASRPTTADVADRIVTLEDFALVAIARRSVYQLNAIISAYCDVFKAIAQEPFSRAREAALGKIADSLGRTVEHLLSAGFEGHLADVLDGALVLLQVLENRHATDDVLDAVIDVVATAAGDDGRRTSETHLLKSVRLTAHAIPRMFQDKSPRSAYLLTRYLPRLTKAATYHGSDAIVSVCDAIYAAVAILHEACRPFPDVRLRFRGPITLPDGKVLEGGLGLESHFESDLRETLWECAGRIGELDYVESRWPFRAAKRLLRDAEDLLDSPVKTRTPGVPDLSWSESRVPGSDVWMRLKKSEGDAGSIPTTAEVSFE